LIDGLGDVLEKERGRDVEGFCFGFWDVGRKRRVGISENLREVEPGFVGWGGRLRSPTGWTKNYSDGRAESRPGTGLFAD